ncbi:MAG: putative colanic acid biosynthesis acetyltransferase [Phycisphaerales bacterium]|nr:putative colanic acid biosynthesis acetyltransferase [Phycisphaerales bacterium]
MAPPDPPSTPPTPTTTPATGAPASPEIGPPTTPIPEQDSPHTFGNRAGRVLWGLAYTLLFRPSPRPLHRWRNLLLRAFGARLHPTARVYPKARIWAPWNLTMGAHACIADDVDVYNVLPITLGDSSTVSQYSYLCGATHDFEHPDHPLVPLPISIGRNVWIAADVFVAPGVTIADGTVVGARSTVLKDLPAWTVAVGYPARPVKPRIIRS